MLSPSMPVLSQERKEIQSWVEFILKSQEDVSIRKTNFRKHIRDSRALASMEIRLTLTTPDLAFSEVMERKLCLDLILLLLTLASTRSGAPLSERLSSIPRLEPR